MPKAKKTTQASSSSAPVKYLPSQRNCYEEQKTIIVRKPTVSGKIGNFFKGTDGWDELGSGLGQTLPGVGEHIATLSMLGILTPAVYLGIKGMASEMDENHQMLDKLREAKEGLLNELKRLFGDGFNIDINQKGIRGGGDILKLLSENEPDPNKFNKKIEALTKYYNNHTDMKIQKMAYHAAPLGLAAMTGMTAGMVTATARSVAEIVPTAGAEIAAHGLEIATAGLFIPAQVAMVGYGIYKAREGFVRNNDWKDKQKALNLIDPNNQNVQNYRQDEQEHAVDADSHKYISIPNINSDAGKKMFSAVQDYIKQRKKYNNMGKTIYGTGMAISEMGMMAGSIMVLTPAAAIAPAIMIPSEVATIGFAGLRIYAQDKEGKFTGYSHNHIHDGSIKQAWQNAAQQEGRKIANLFRSRGKQKPIEEYTGQGTDCGHNHSKIYIDNPNKLADDFTNTTRELAIAKLKSLALYAQKHNKSISDFEKMVKTGKESWFLGTTLQSDVLQEMMVLYLKNRDHWHNMFVRTAPESASAEALDAGTSAPAAEAPAGNSVLKAISEETKELNKNSPQNAQQKYFDTILYLQDVPEDNNSLLFGTQISDKDRIITMIMGNPLFKQKMADIYIDYEHKVEKETVKRNHGNQLAVKHKNTNIFTGGNPDERENILNTMLDNPNILQQLSEFITKDYKSKYKQDRTHIMENLIFLAQQVQMKNQQSSRHLIK